MYHDVVCINNYTKAVRSVPAQALVLALSTPVCAIPQTLADVDLSLMPEQNIFDDAGRHAPAGPALDTDNA